MRLCRLACTLGLVLCVGCGPKKLVHAGPIVFREMSCTITPEGPVCTCEVPMLVLNAKTGADEVSCRKGK